MIGPDKKVKLQIAYPMTTGRNFDEVLRVIDSLQLTAKHKVSTPVNWKQGDDVIIAGSVSDDEAKKTYPGGWKSPRPVHPDRSAAEVKEVARSKRPARAIARSAGASGPGVIPRSPANKQMNSPRTIAVAPHTW